MSDWRKEAVEIDPTGKIHGGWMDEAVPVEHPKESDIGGAAQAGLEAYGNTATLGNLAQLQAKGPEILGAVARSIAPALPVDAIVDHFKNPNADLDADLKAKGFTVENAPDKSYIDSRDENLKRYAKQDAEHPVATGVGKGFGFLASALVPGGQVAKGAGLAEKAYAGAKAGALMGAVANPGDTEGVVDPLQIKDRALNAGVGAGLGAAAPVVLHGAGNASSKVSQYLRNKAAQLAETATGATGAQSANFVPGTGRKLLNKGIIKFGSSPADIGKNAESALDAAQASKMGLIEKDLAGASVDRNKVYDAIQKKIAALRGDESQTALVRQLESKLDDVIGAADASGSSIPLSKSEGVRRGFDKAAKWDSNSDAPTREANKVLANIYRESGEDAAKAVNPSAAEQFKGEKTLQHTLLPVVEAAEKRAAQLKQSPHGGLLDMTSGGLGATVGGVVGGPAGAALGAGAGLAAKALRPRYASMGAIGADALSQMLRKGGVVARGLNPLVAARVAERTRIGEKGLQKDPDPILNDQKLMEIFRKDPSLIDTAIDDEKVKAKIKRAIAASTSGSP